MSETTSDESVIAVLIERLEKQRLPCLLALKEKVNNVSVSILCHPYSCIPVDLCCSRRLFLTAL